MARKKVASNELEEAMVFIVLRHLEFMAGFFEKEIGEKQMTGMVAASILRLHAREYEMGAGYKQEGDA